MINRANGTRSNGHRANGKRADVVAPPERDCVSNIILIQQDSHPSYRDNSFVNQAKVVPIIIKHKVLEKFRFADQFL